METLSEWGARGLEVMMQFKKAAENLWEILESYGVTVEKLEEVKAAVDAGTLSRREARLKLGLPATEYRE